MILFIVYSSALMLDSCGASVAYVISSNHHFICNVQTNGSSFYRSALIAKSVQNIADLCFAIIIFILISCE